MTGPPFDHSDSLVFLTIRVGKLLANEIRSNELMETHGLVSHHMGILVDLWMRDGVRQQDLAVSTIKDKASITRALAILEEKNILVRVPDAKDKRSKRIFLTHKGRELEQELMPLADEAVGRAIHGIAPEEVLACKAVLKKMYENLNT